MRPVISLLLLAALAIGGCDRQSQPGSQASETIANTIEPAPAPQNELVVEEVIGTLDRTHKGEAGPATAFENPAGAAVTLASFTGKPVLLNLWATWCAPCVKEMPTLDALAEAKGEALHVLTISQDFKGGEVVAPFFAKAGYKKLQPYLDMDAAWSLGLGANLPTTILFDSAGKEVWRVAGDMDWTGAKAAALLAEAS